MLTPERSSTQHYTGRGSRITDRTVASVIPVILLVDANARVWATATDHMSRSWLRQMTT